MSLFDEGFCDPPSEAATTIKVTAEVHGTTTTTTATDTSTTPSDLNTGFIYYDDEDSIDINDLRATSSRRFPDSDSDDSMTV